MEFRSLGQHLVATARLTRDARAHVRATVDLAGARAAIKGRLDNREDRLIHQVSRTVYARPTGPYARLLDSVGCGRHDFERLVRAEGIEGALGALARLGVYTTQAEQKCRVPIIRGSTRIVARPGDFDSPLPRAHFIVPTSGSTGRPAPAGRSLPEYALTGDLLRVAMAAHGFRARAHVMCQSAPTYIGVYSRLGEPMIGWHNPMATLSPLQRAGQAYIVALMRCVGYPVPFARHMPVSEPLEMARWLAAQLPAHTSILVTAYTGIASRTSSAATAAGIDLEGIAWLAHGEPISAARRATIESSGARVIARYGTTESGCLGMGCASPSAVDDIHVSTDRFAVIRHKRAATREDIVRALLVTAIDPSISRVMLNAEMGDDAELEVRECGCLVGDGGLTTHLSSIRSFEKLTGLGMTFAGQDVERIVESTLPRQLGGGAEDYQLVETEDLDGNPRIVLRIHPRLPAVDPVAAVDSLLSALAEGSDLNRHMAGMLREARAVVVAREAPVPTRSGKIPAFVPLQRDARRP
jgi:hypothetical protein